MKINEKLFVKQYVSQIVNTFEKIESKEIINCKKLILDKIKKKRNIYICGNGGSSSIANHFLCDFNKGIKESSKKNNLKPKVISFTANTDYLTAIANDISYENIFSYQLENYGSTGDLLILFSCSGKSKNIILAAELAKKMNIDIISFVGFTGKNSKLKKLSRLFLNLKINNYGICEDIFQSLMHIISQLIRIESSNKKINIL